MSVAANKHRRRLYFDYAATAPLRPEARAAMIDAMDRTGNASSVHGEGRYAKKTIERAREQVAALAGARPSQIVFTSGATEANNWVLKAPWRRRLVSSVEHASVLEPARALDAELIGVSGDGLIDIPMLQAALQQSGGDGALISVQMVGNETGVLQPLETIVELASGVGAVVHTDAVQALGKMPVGFSKLGLGLMSLSAHKLGGPQGVGALILREDQKIPGLLAGGAQENRKRAGTENVAAIAGFGAAAAAAQRDLDRVANHRAWQQKLEAELKSLVPGSVIFGEAAPRVPGITCVGVPGIGAEAMVIGLDLAGVAVSAGSACSSGKVTRSHVLEAMGAPATLTKNALRLSFGWQAEEHDIDELIKIWAVETARMSPALSADETAPRLMEV